jgi:hypothetical protein
MQPFTTTLPRHCRRLIPWQPIIGAQLVRGLRPQCPEGCEIILDSFPRRSVLSGTTVTVYYLSLLYPSFALVPFVRAFRNFLTCAHVHSMHVGSKKKIELQRAISSYIDYKLQKAHSLAGCGTS